MTTTLLDSFLGWWEDYNKRTDRSFTPKGIAKDAFLAGNASNKKERQDKK